MQDAVPISWNIHHQALKARTCRLALRNFSSGAEGTAACEYKSRRAGRSSELVPDERSGDEAAQASVRRERAGDPMPQKVRRHTEEPNNRLQKFGYTIPDSLPSSQRNSRELRDVLFELCYRRIASGKARSLRAASCWL